MESQPASYKFLMSLDTLVDLETEAALNHVGVLIDISKDLGKVEGLQRVFQLSDELQERQLSPGQRAILEYFSANACANLRQLSERGKDRAWEWEQKEFEEEDTRGSGLAIQHSLRSQHARDCVVAPVSLESFHVDLLSEIG